MKKKMVYVAAALIIGAVTVFNVKTVLDANRNYDLAITSIDALSEDGEGESDGGGESDTGAKAKDINECRKINGYWDMALLYDGGGITKVDCKKEGEIKVWGKSIISFKYNKGEQYNIAWENWSCKDKPGSGACCRSDKQGMRIRSI